MSSDFPLIIVDIIGTNISDKLHHLGKNSF